MKNYHLKKKEAKDSKIISLTFNYYYYYYFLFFI